MSSSIATNVLVSMLVLRGVDGLWPAERNAEQHYCCVHDVALICIIDCIAMLSASVAYGMQHSAVASSLVKM